MLKWYYTRTLCVCSNGTYTWTIIYKDVYVQMVRIHVLCSNAEKIELGQTQLSDGRAPFKLDAH